MPGQPTHLDAQNPARFSDVVLGVQRCQATAEPKSMRSEADRLCYAPDVELGVKPSVVGRQ